MSDTLSEFRRSRSHERVLAHYLIEKALAELQLTSRGVVSTNVHLQ